jgi:hypothetical protein
LDEQVLTKWRCSIEDKGYFAVGVFGKVPTLHPDCKARMLKEARLDLMFYLMGQHPELDVEPDPLVSSSGKLEATKTRGIGLTRGLSSTCRLFHFCLAPLFARLLNKTKVVNTLDFPQYVPPGQKQDYEGHTGHCPVTSLLTLTTQKVKGTTVPPGTLVVYDAKKAKEEELFPVNDTTHPWLGLRIGYWPLKEETYTLKQRMTLFQERFRPIRETGLDPFAVYEKRYLLGYYDTTAASKEFCMERIKPATGKKLENSEGKSQIQGTDKKTLDKRKPSQCKGGNEKLPKLKRTLVELEPSNELMKGHCTNGETYASEILSKKPRIKMSDQKESSKQDMLKLTNRTPDSHAMNSETQGLEMLNSKTTIGNGKGSNGFALTELKDTERKGAHDENGQRTRQLSGRNSNQDCDKESKIPTKKTKKRSCTEKDAENCKSIVKEYRPAQKLRKAESQSENDDCVLLEQVPPKKSYTNRPKKQVFSLTPQSKERILNGKWLDADAINVAQEILSKTSQMQGFQPTTLSESLNFEKVREPFVQILFDKERSHWLCISSQNPADQKGPPIVNVYDSLGKGRVSPCITKQIEAIVSDWKGNLVFPPVQQQLNHVDCGVFAIAFATHAALGKNPAGITFNTNIMRNHLLQCLERKQLSTFPTVDLDWQEIEEKVAVLTSAQMEKVYGVEWFNVETLFPKPKPKNLLWMLRNICRIYEKKPKKPDASLTVSEVLNMHKFRSKEARHVIGWYAAGMLGIDEFQERMHSIVSEQISCILFMRGKEGFAKAYQCTSGVGDLFIKRIVFNYKAFRELLPKGSF